MVKYRYDIVKYMVMHVASWLEILCIHACRILITATDIEEFPSKLVFFNNFEEDSEFGKGMN